MNSPVGEFKKSIIRPMISDRENGLRVVQPMTLMTVGFCNEPAGAYLHSILFSVD
jgi:hypothetical protein